METPVRFGDEALPFCMFSLGKVQISRGIASKTESRGVAYSDKCHAHFFFVISTLLYIARLNLGLDLHSSTLIIHALTCHIFILLFTPTPLTDVPGLHSHRSSDS